jgi:hypothetical protein
MMMKALFPITNAWRKFIDSRSDQLHMGYDATSINDMLTPPA